MFNDDFNELLIFEYNIDSDLILESRKEEAKLATPQIIRLFTHLLKYQFQSNRQGRSWYTTIYDSYNQINGYNIDSINCIDLDTCYDKARTIASKETKLPLNRFPKDRIFNWDVEFITDINLIIDYLYQYYDKDATYNIDLDEFLKEKGYR